MSKSTSRSITEDVHVRLSYMQPKYSSCTPTAQRFSNTVSWTDYTVSGDNPYYRDQIKAGVDATTPFSGYSLSVKYNGVGFATVSMTAPDDGFCRPILAEYEGPLVKVAGITQTVSVSAETALNRAKGSFINSAKQALNPFDTGTFMAELRKTLHMIRNPAIALRGEIDRYFRELKKVPQKWSSQRRRKALISTYLEATFGWLPLFGDVQGGLELLRRYQQQKPFELSNVHAYGSNEGMACLTSTTFYTYLNIFFEERRYRRISYYMSGGIKGRSYASSTTLPNNFGLMPEHWLPTAGELLPYSFLIDYFTNIGNIIDAWSLCNGSLAWCSQTKRDLKSTTRTAHQAVGVAPFPSAVKSTSYSPAVGVRLEKTVDRTSVSSIIPSLDIRLPGFGTRRSLNIAALAYQGFVRRPFY